MPRPRAVSRAGQVEHKAVSWRAPQKLPQWMVQEPALRL